jgi:hypothetical protein
MIIPKYDYANEFSEFLNNYKQKKNYTGVLFYFYTNDSLKIWLLARDRFYHSATRISKDSLLQVELDLRNALKVDQLATSRMPVKRGIKPDTISTKSENDSKLSILHPSFYSGNRLKK